MQRQPVSSSQIRSLGHDPATSTLEVEFHSGGVYQYVGVDALTHKAMAEADSIGAHFHSNIRGKFPFRKVS